MELPGIPWNQFQVERYRDRPDLAQGYLDIAFEESEKDGLWSAYLAAIRTIAEARGGHPLLAELERSHADLLGALSRNQHPDPDQLAAILKELGCHPATQSR